MADEKQFAGRVAIVTGGTRGIGRAIALELGRRGADVAFNYAKSAEAADSLKAELEALGVRSLSVQCDVASTEAAASMVQQVKEAFGRIDFLVNNKQTSRIKYESVQYNQRFADSLFAKPADVKSIK
jgi:3-oxoacyl-[acyl-carrier protein] reductase